MEHYVMALDQGTTSSRCVIFDSKGQIVGSSQKEFTQYYPQNGYVEHDAMEIWETQLDVMHDVMKKLKLTYENITCIGITNQRETTVIWDRETGEPIYHAIVWQCRRTASRITSIVNEGLAPMITQKTGLIPDAYFSASKIEWLLDHVDGARDRANRHELMFGTIDTWLIYNLTKGKIFATDYTNASRTMLYNIHTLAWDEELLKLFHIPASILPAVKPSSAMYGYCDEEWLGGSVPICGVAGDQQAALFGQCCFKPGEAKNTYGTGCFLLMNTGKSPVVSKHGLLTTIAASLNETDVEYALEGSVFVAGAAIQWLRDELHMIDHAEETEELARSVTNSNGVYVVPAFTGLGAPYWDAYARGAVFGLSRGTSRAHFVRATLESLAYQSFDLIHTMELDSSLSLSSLRVDGGACANNYLMEFQSDLLKGKVVRPKTIESTALGAAYLAGLYTGYYESKAKLRENALIERTFSPSMAEETRNELIDGWHDAVNRTRSK